MRKFSGSFVGEKKRKDNNSEVKEKRSQCATCYKVYFEMFELVS